MLRPRRCCSSPGGSGSGDGGGTRRRAGHAGVERTSSPVAALALLAVLLLLAVASGAQRGGRSNGVEANKDKASSTPTSRSPSELPPLLLRSGTVDVRPGRGLTATRLSHSVGRRLLSEAPSARGSSDVPIAPTTDARWGPLRSSPPSLLSKPLALASRLFSGKRRGVSPPPSPPKQLVVAFSSAPPPHGAAEQLSRVLRRHGGALGSFLPEASFVAVGDGAGRAAAAVKAAVPGVAAVGELPAESKLSPELVGDVLARRYGEDDEGETVTTTLAVVFPRLGRAAGGVASDDGTCGDAGYDPSSAASVDWEGPLSLLSSGGSGSVRVSGRAGRHVSLVEVTEEVSRPSPPSVPRPSPSSPSLPLASAAVRWLAAQPSTHWISVATLEAERRNWQASSIIQSGRGAPSGGSAADASTHPLWAANVTGAGQVVGGGDSGLDLSHCFFSDPAVPVELKQVGGGGSGGWRGFFGGGNGAGGGGSVFESEKHRKIRLYRTTSTSPPVGGGGNGHGTHTMGSLCGSPFDPSGSPKAFAYRGMAPDAKLAFSDLSSSKAGSGGKSSGSILVPGDMGGDYYRFAYDAGARVHSDSWGSSSLEYDYMSSEVDAFSFKHQDFVPVLAAGNEGSASASPSRGVTTVTAPATAKNCIAVGASQSAYAHGAGSAGSAFSLHKLTVFQQANGAGGGDGGDKASSGNPTEVESFRVVQAQFGGRLSSLYGKRLTLAAASPPDACGNLDNSAAVGGSALIVARGGCTFADKAAAAQGAGAVALLVYDDRISDFFIPAASNGGGDSGAGRDLSIPAAALPRRVGQLLASAAAAAAGDARTSPSASSPPTRITVSFGPPPSAGDPWDSLADFSSKGPTPDGRIKPDLVAPGVLQSAAAATTVGDGGDGDGLFGRSSGNPSPGSCPLRTMQGTSMATPVVAGAAALVRSYFAQGFYPSGSPDPSRSFEPGGSLVKAVLAAGAAPLDGFEVDTGLPLAPPPSYRMGFGRVHLARSLPLASSDKSKKANSPSWSLQVVDRAPISGGDAHRFCLRSKGGPLTVVLAWHDAPGSPSSGRALVNDLDLVVRAAGLGGLPLVGNGGGSGSGKGENDKASSGSPPPDRLNNVESVAVAYLPPGDVSIEVRGSSVPRGPQPYSLAALGEFSGVLASERNPSATGAAAAAAGDKSGRCDVVVATVRRGPEGVVNTRDVEFEFGTAAGGGGGGTFECSLDESDESPPLWKPCASPAKFKSLADGKHVFRVRAQGETSAASRSFVVDATPPSLWWRRGGEGGNLPKSDEGRGSPSAAATISFGADDASPVSFRCRLESVQEGSGSRPLPPGFPGSSASALRLWTAAEAVAAAGDAPTSPSKAPRSPRSPPAPLAVSSVPASSSPVPGVGRARPIKLGEWYGDCTSPASFAWLPPGRWRASVDAADAAGNAAATPLSHEFSVSPPSAPRAPFLVAGPFGPSNSSSAEFELRALTSDGRLDAVSAADAPQCQLLPLKRESESSSSPPGAPSEGRQPTPVADTAERAWTTCGPKLGAASYGPKLADGGYQFAVRFGGGGASGKRRRRLAAPAANDSATSSPFAFSIFGVDTTPPNVTVSLPSSPSSAQQPVVLPRGSLEVEFSASEPASFTCFLSSTAAPKDATVASAAEKKQKQKDAAAAPQKHPLVTFPCASPANYSNLPDGSYFFSVVATDAVGNASPRASPPPPSAPPQPRPTSAFSFVVDTLPPDVPSPSLSPPLASREGSFNATFAASDAGSGVARTQCRLRLLAAPGAASEDSKPTEGAFEDCASPFAATGLAKGRWGLTVRATDAAGNSAESAEASFYVDDSPPAGASVTASPPKDRPSPPKVTLAFAAPPDAASAPVTKWECSLAKVDGGRNASSAAAPRGVDEGASTEPTAPRSWQKCSSPAVFKGLKSGEYSFQARATDAAGNVGAPTKAATFAVDASLPVPRDDGGGYDSNGTAVGDFFARVADWFNSLSGWRLWAVVAGGVALAVLLATVVCCCCCCGGGGGRGRPPLPQQQQDRDAAALAAALAASQRDADAAAAAARAREAAALEAAVQASREEELVRRAIARSMVEK